MFGARARSLLLTRAQMPHPWCRLRQPRQVGSSGFLPGHTAAVFLLQETGRFGRSALLSRCRGKELCPEVLRGCWRARRK